ncbi:FeoA family protein [Hydrogenimonas sp.]
MKPITECRIGCEGTIVKIRAKEPVRGRLFSLGLAKGSHLKVLDHTLAKQTWEVESDGTKIALREEEAASIFIDDDACAAKGEA